MFFNAPFLWQKFSISFVLVLCIGLFTIWLENADAQPPDVSRIQLVFEDRDESPGEIEGTLKIQRPKNDENIIGYQIFWGMNSQSRLRFHGIICGGRGVSHSKEALSSKQATSASSPDTGRDCLSRSTKNGPLELTYNFPPNTLIPVEASHFLVYVTNDSYETLLGASLRIKDKGMPDVIPGEISMSDEDPDMGQLGGNLVIGKSADEDELTHYVLYWGTGPDLKLPNLPPIVIIPKEDNWLRIIRNNLVFRITSDTPIPDSATHILAYARKGTNETKHSASWKIADLGCVCNLGCRNNWYREKEKLTCLQNEGPVVGMHFQSKNIDDKIFGEVFITLGNEYSNIKQRTGIENIEYFLLYWGNAQKEKLDGYGPIAIAETDINLDDNENRVKTIEIPTNFKITEKSLENLKKEGLPGNVIEQLTNSLLNKEYQSEKEFMNALERIGAGPRVRYKELLLKFAETSVNQQRPSEAQYILLYTGNVNGEHSQWIHTKLPEKNIPSPTQGQLGLSYARTEFDKQGVNLFWSYPLQEQFQIKIQLSHGKSTVESEGENIVDVERNLLSSSIQWFFLKDTIEAISSKDLNPKETYKKVLNDFFIGAGLGIGRTFLRYDARKFLQKKDEKDELVIVKIENSREQYKAVANGIFWQFEVGWHSRHWPFHLGVQTFLPALYGDNFNKSEIPDFSNHRTKAEEVWEASTRINQVYIGIHYLF